MGTATKVRNVTGWRGDAALFRLDPPMDDGTELVIASAIDLDFAGVDMGDYRRSETMVFRSNAKGEVANWAEIGFVAHKSHADALNDMGYDVA